MVMVGGSSATAAIQERRVLSPVVLRVTGDTWATSALTVHAELEFSLVKLNVQLVEKREMVTSVTPFESMFYKQ